MASGSHDQAPHRLIITLCTVGATLMQALDQTIANVALPYMQGSLSASFDEITWVLTSYITAAAIMTAPVGWISARFGLKRLFLISMMGFIVASMLCGVAETLPEMVLFRLLQGVFGAALVPLSQAVLLDSYSAEERGSAMAIWGIGVMLGPIMGPTLGAWLTDNYNWHWVFFINLPVGIVTVIGLMLFMDETQQQKQLRFDWFGFLALAVGIGAMQLMLDRGEQLGWFESGEIVAETVVSVVGFYFFFAHSLTSERPFVRFDIFKDRTYVGGCLFMAIIGLVLFGTMALVTPFMQNVLGYPILTAGFLLASRGVGTLAAMMVVGRLMKIIPPRYLVLAGMLLAAFTLGQMVDFTDQTSPGTIVVASVVQGVGLGLVFVPLSTVAFATLPGNLRTDGTAILTLVRNLGSSVGISVVIAQLTSTTSGMHARLSEFVTPFNDALAMPDAAMLNLNTDLGRAMMDRLLTQQATIIAYANDYKLLMYLTLTAIQLVFVIGVARARPAAPATPPAPAH